MIDLVDWCSGCGLCYIICPQNAIYKIEDERGFYKYECNHQKCIKCGLCIKKCPSNNTLLHEKQNTFYVVDFPNNKRSSSGGICYALAAKYLSLGDVVYGAAWNVEKQAVTHIRVDTLNDLKRIQGSKYVQSEVSKKLLMNIKKDLKEKKVLFFGCPCQVAELRSFTNDNENLMCVDLVCHGVNSPKMLSDQIKLITVDKVKDLSFRDGLNFRFKIRTNQKSFEKNSYDVPYYSLYLQFASLKESCYKCKYACDTRVGDITVGDYVENNIGMSMVVVNTHKGYSLFKKLDGYLYFDKKNISLAYKNHAFTRPTDKNSLTDRFTINYKRYGLKKAYYITFYKFAIKRMLKKIFGDKYYEKIKGILKR